LVVASVAAVVIGGGLAATVEGQDKGPGDRGSGHSSPAAGLMKKRAASKLLCATRDGTRYVRRKKPKRCTIFGPGGTFGGGVNLRKLRPWHGWGKGQARARGIERGFHLPPQHIKVKVRAWRPRMRCGHRVYTRFKVKSRFGTSRPKPAPCPGPVF
jgi:hypothetical protein